MATVPEGNIRNAREDVRAWNKSVFSCLSVFFGSRKSWQPARLIHLSGSVVLAVGSEGSSSPALMSLNLDFLIPTQNQGE